MEKENSTENYESSLVRKFVDDLNKGQSFLQASNQKPDYVLNASTNEVFQGINMIIVGQAMRDNNKVSAQALTLNQRDSLDYMSAPGTKHIATAIYDKYDAWWRKNDPEVIAGKEVAGTHKKNADGTYVKDKIFSLIFAADDIRKRKFVAERDEEGNVVHYTEDIYKKDKNGNNILHTSDGKTKLKDGTEISFKKGDPIIEHHKGAVKGSYNPSDERIVSTQPANLPPLYSEELAPIPKRKDDSTKEMFVEKLAIAFRGKLQGNFEGINFSKKEIAAIADEYLGHQNQFINAVKSAENRANMTVSEYNKMMENINAKNNSMTEVNQNVHVNEKKASRKH